MICNYMIMVIGWNANILDDSLQSQFNQNREFLLIDFCKYNRLQISVFCCHDAMSFIWSKTFFEP